LDDKALIARVLAGDTAAAKMLYDRHVASVYRFMYRMAGEDALAQDWVQDTFIRVFSRLADFRGDSSFSTWLRAVARSVALNGLRKVKRFRESEVDLDEVAEVPSEDEATGDSQVQDRIAQAIDALSNAYRPLFIMYDVQGFTHEEIATSLGLAVGTSKVKLFRARAQLRERLADLALEV